MAFNISCVIIVDSQTLTSFVHNSNHRNGVGFFRSSVFHVKLYHRLVLWWHELHVA